MKFGSGQSVKRVEDGRLLTGKGRFTDDHQLPGMVYGVVVRSPHAHAIIRSIDASAARAMPGVLAVYTAADLQAYGTLPCLVNFNPAHATPRSILATERVRFVGEEVAFVVAGSRSEALLAAEQVMVDYDDLPAAATIESACAEGAPLVWPHSAGNVPWTWETGDAAATDAAFSTAAHVTRLRIVQNRVAPTSMEARAALASHDGETGFTLVTGTQGVNSIRGILAGMLKIDPAELRVITQDVGGGFGMKSFPYPEYLLVLHAARELGRPVKWTGGRGEAFMTDTHGRDLITDAALALDADGRMLAMKTETRSALGAYHSFLGGAIQTLAGGKMMGGVYNLPAIHNKVIAVLTNSAPVDAYRGAGRPEATYITERLVDAAARELGIEPDELRRRNLLRPEQLPHMSPLGVRFDIGDFPALLDTALNRADWSGFAARKAASAGRGLRRGRGIGTYVEITAFSSNEETADARFTDDGMLEIAVGTQSNGQGHETVYAQIAAAHLGIEMDRIRIVQGDSTRLEVGHGTGGSRSLHFGGSAVIMTADALVAAARPLAAAALDSEMIDFADGLFRAAGTNRSIDLFSLAAKHPSALNVRASWKVPQPTPTFPNGCHICEVEIDPDTGMINLARYTVVDDFGTLLNPMLVLGQVHGGIAQGLGQALLEDVVYDAQGQLLTASFMDYGMPRAHHMPDIQFESRPVPSPTNPLGVKGCGEAGTIGAMPAIMNAIVDALDGHAVDMPATPEKIWRLCSALRQRQAA